MDARMGGAWVSPTTAEAFAGGTWRTLKYAEAYYSGAWRKIVSFVLPLTLSATGGSGSAASSTVTGNTATATPSGGLAPFTYSWVHLSGATMTINTPSSASTTFTASGVADGATVTATFRCTATDSLGSTATADLTVNLTNRTGITGTA